MHVFFTQPVGRRTHVLLRGIRTSCKGSQSIVATFVILALFYHALKCQQNTLCRHLRGSRPVLPFFEMLAEQILSLLRAYFIAMDMVLAIFCHALRSLQNRFCRNLYDSRSLLPCFNKHAKQSLFKGLRPRGRPSPAPQPGPAAPCTKPPPLPPPPQACKAGTIYVVLALFYHALKCLQSRHCWLGPLFLMSIHVNDLVNAHVNTHKKARERPPLHPRPPLNQAPADFTRLRN